MMERWVLWGIGVYAALVFAVLLATGQLSRAQSGGGFYRPGPGSSGSVQTNDNRNLYFSGSNIRLGEYAGTGASGTNWMSLGYLSGMGALGNEWIAQGSYAGYGATGDYWTALGPYAGYLAYGSRWFAAGRYAGNLASGDYWTAIGNNAGSQAQGDSWTAVGNGAGYNSQTTMGTFIGRYAGRNAKGTATLFIDNYENDPGQSHNPTNDAIHIAQDGQLYLGRPTKGVTMRGPITVGSLAVDASGGTGTLSGAAAYYTIHQDTFSAVALTFGAGAGTAPCTVTVINASEISVPAAWIQLGGDLSGLESNGVTVVSLWPWPNDGKMQFLAANAGGTYEEAPEW